MSSIEQFNLPVTRRQALVDLKHFMQHGLTHFGRYQDATSDASPFFYHSRLSAALNIGLLTPHEVCEATAQRYYTGDALINAVEGLFTRYWDGEGMFGGSTGPKCQLIRLQTSLAFSATQMTIDNNYAHHIQRLMVTGNFALLCEIKPEALCDWYLAVYADASEWVELPNTLGMVLHAGGGLIGSKPYCASGKYIDKMSDH